MKNSLLILMAMVSSVAAQTGGNPAATSAAGTAASAGTTRNAAPFSPAAPGLPGFSGTPLPATVGSQGAVGFTNGTDVLNNNQQFGTNGIPPQVSGLLANVQAAIQQALPAIAAYNNSVAANAAMGGAAQAGLGGTQIGTGTSRGTPSASGVNLGTQLGGNASTRLGVNAGANLSAAPGGSAPSTVSGVTTTTSNSRGGLAANNITGTTANEVATDNSAPGATATGFGVGSTDVKQLAFLQAEMERLLPMIAAFNGGSGVNTGVNTGTATTPNNQIGAPPNQTLPPPQTSVRTLSPTGRTP